MNNIQITALQNLSIAHAEIIKLSDAWEIENGEDFGDLGGSGTMSEGNPYAVAAKAVSDAIWSANEVFDNIATDGGWKNTDWVAA